MRIFTPNGVGPIYWTFHTLIWGNPALYIALLFAVVFQYTPEAKIWDPNMASGHCISNKMILLVQGPVNVLSNLLILLLPTWIKWHLHLATKRRLGIIAVFAMGAGYALYSLVHHFVSFNNEMMPWQTLINFLNSAVVCSICRMVYIIRINDFNADATYVGAPAMLWTYVGIQRSQFISCSSYGD